MNAWINPYSTSVSSQPDAWEYIGDTCMNNFAATSTPPYMYVTPDGKYYNVNWNGSYFVVQKLFDPSFGGGCTLAVNTNGIWPPPGLGKNTILATQPPAPNMPPMPPLATSYKTLSTPTSGSR